MHPNIYESAREHAAKAVVWSVLLLKGPTFEFLHFFRLLKHPLNTNKPKHWDCHICIRPGRGQMIGLYASPTWVVVSLSSLSQAFRVSEAARLRPPAERSKALTHIAAALAPRVS